MLRWSAEMLENYINALASSGAPPMVYAHMEQAARRMIADNKLAAGVLAARVDLEKARAAFPPETFEQKVERAAEARYEDVWNGNRAWLNASGDTKADYLRVAALMLRAAGVEG